MAEEITVEDLKALFQQAALRSEEAAQLSKEAAQLSKDASQHGKEMDGRLTQQLAQMNAELNASLDRSYQRLVQRMERISDRLGEFAEAMVIPACETIFEEWGIPVHVVARNAKSRIGDRSMEIDIIVVNDDHVVVVEVKSRLKTKDVDWHVARLAEFKTFFRHFRSFKVIGAVASIALDDDVARYAYRQGLFVLGQSGETVTIANDRDFVPKIW